MKLARKNTREASYACKKVGPYRRAQNDRLGETSKPKYWKGFQQIRACLAGQEKVGVLEGGTR